MAASHPSITPEQAALIRGAALFFVASADPRLAPGPDGLGPVNVSPKGGVALHVLGPNLVAYLDYAGSGSETARHAAAGGPVTVMVCSFEERDAAIVRLYGRARMLPLEQAPSAPALLAAARAHESWPRRSVVEVAVERTMTSCGYGVPVLARVRERGPSDRGRRYKAARAGAG